jgi:hypothetical protein
MRREQRHKLQHRIGWLFRTVTWSGVQGTKEQKDIILQDGCDETHTCLCRTPQHLHNTRTRPASGCHALRITVWKRYITKQRTEIEQDLRDAVQHSDRIDDGPNTDSGVQCRKCWNSKRFAGEDKSMRAWGAYQHS